LGTKKYNTEKLLKLQKEFQSINSNKLDNDYFVTNFGGKFFSEYNVRVIWGI